MWEAQVLQSVLPIKDEEVVLGQYDGYRDDPTVPDHSNTPTFATAVLRIHNERWEGIILFWFIYLLNCELTTICWKKFWILYWEIDFLSHSQAQS